MFRNLRYRFALFMQGRYGSDQLSRCMSIISLILIIASTVMNRFLAFPGVLTLSRIFRTIVAVFLFLIYFRFFSRNIPRRYAENQKYLALKGRIASFFGRSRHSAAQRIEYHIYKCPHCSQKIRIPRGKGRIMVRCPKCNTEFMKQS